MKKLYINNCSIEISLETDYNFKSADNKQYDKIINLMRNEERTKTISIKIEKDENIKEVALIVPFFTYVDKCALPTEQYIFFMFDKLLCLFNPITMEIVKQTEIPSSGTMFSLLSYDKDFILYGEMEIYRVTKDLKIKWEFLGKDIFVRYKGEEPAFEMKEDRICLYDFEDNYYEIDYDGKIIEERFASKK